MQQTTFMQACFIATTCPIYSHMTRLASYISLTWLVKMNRIVVALLISLTFVQVVRCQTAGCIRTLFALSDQCSDLLATVNPAVCNGTCETPLDTIQTDCESSVSS